jgi:Flp pilus assembly pilin Flp
MGQSGCNHAGRGNLTSETGATAVEYAVMMGLIAAIIIATVTTLGLATEGIFADLLARWP